jgi:hypothetical protein
VTVEEEALDALVQLASGDARRALTALEAAAASALAMDGPEDGSESAAPSVTPEIVSASVDRALLRYDRNGDQHYDVISAFIKSMRGSDPDAAIHYLARMIEAGEDPRFIARRLMVHAAEDVGMADPQALQIAVAAAEATQLIGLPEARIPLAEATIYIATAPKSNAVISAIDAAIADVKRGNFGLVPKHRARSAWGTARATAIPTATRGACRSSSTCPTSCRTGSTTSRRCTATSERSRTASRRSGASRAARRGTPAIPDFQTHLLRYPADSAAHGTRECGRRSLVGEEARKLIDLSLANIAPAAGCRRGAYGRRPVAGFLQWSFPHRRRCAASRA